MEQIPDGSVVVTAAEVYQELRATHAEVMTLGVKFDEWKQGAKEDISDHERRIRGLEKRVWIGAGMATVVSALVGVSSSLLVGHP